MAPRSGLHLALMRGINVGGRNKLPMKDLKAVFVDLGADDVVSYIQSGNVLFRASTALAARMPELVRAAVLERFGLALPVVTRTAAELTRVVKNNPFLRAGKPTEHLSVAFLGERPKKALVAQLDPDRSPPDELEVRGREVFLCCPNGVAGSKITNAWLDRQLETVSTARNWRTVLALLELTQA